MFNIIIKAENLHKYYSINKQRTFKEFLPALVGGKDTKLNFTALEGINFEIRKGESLGIVGKNGSGKSTLLKIIAGVTKPSDGIIEVNGKVFPLIELGAGFHPEMTGKENVYLNASILGMKKKEVDSLYPDIVNFAELHNFMNEPVKHYSSGMYMRLAFAVAVAKIPDILLVDEIMAVGDLKFQKKCFKRIEEFQKQGTTIVMVAHNMKNIKDYCKKGLFINEGKQVYFGEVNEAINRYEEMMEE